MDESSPYSLPAIDLARATGQPTGFSTHNNMANPSATRKILEDSAYLLGVRPYHLGQLLGTSSPSQIYQWTAGKKTPCHLYLTRLIQLLLLRVVLGWNFIDIRRIDWETGEVFPREEQEKRGPKKAALPVGEWTFPSRTEPR
ncbi:MAG: hypothetical protein ACE5JL_19805 [Dehalococcoidia bacterium]